MPKRLILKQAQANLFSCIGSACNAACCKGWTITIDEATYKKYKKLPQSDLKKQIIASTSRNRTANGSSESYAKIKFQTQEQICPLIDASGLCAIHRDLGEDYLCTTCKVYPREYNLVDNTVQLSLSLSCPEVPTLLLANKEPMAFDLVEENLAEIYDKRAKLRKLSSQSFKTAKHNAFWDIRSTMISIMQNRKYTIEERLFILTMAANSFDQCDSEEAIQHAITKLANGVNENIYKDCSSAISGTFDTQVKLLFDALKFRNLTRNETTALSFWEQIKEDICAENTDASSIVESQELMHIIATDYDYVLENFMVNKLFTSVYPLNDADLLVGWIKVLVPYTLLKLSLVGNLSKTTLNEETLLQAIQQYARAFDHSQPLLDSIFKLLSANNQMTKAHALILCKNK